MTPAQQQQHDYLLTQLQLLIRSDGNGGLTSAEDLRAFEQLVIDQLFADPHVALDSGPADPTAAQGNVGDFWLNETSGWLWRKYDASAAPGTGGWIKRTLLRGEDSQVPGPQGGQGRQGLQGIQGQSAYQLAVQQGYTGTLTQWLLGLKGNDGPSAYQVAVANGYQGTALQWLASLKGAASTVPGPQGPDGAQGKTGPQGPKGTDGASAYQVALANGFTGTAAQWLASLQGGTFVPIPANHWGTNDPPVALGTQTDVNEYLGGRKTSTSTSTSTSLTIALAISLAAVTAGNPLTFSITTNSGGTSPYVYSVVATNNSTGATTVLGTSASGTWTPQVAGTYSIDATVTDSSNPVRTAQAVTRQLTVNAVANTPPVASAGSDTTLTLPANQAQLMGSGSDPDQGDTLTFAWTQVTGPNTAILGTPTLLNTTASSLVAGSYQFCLTVTDNHGASTKSYVVVHVNAAAQPTISGYTPASGPAGTQVSISGANFGDTQETGNVKFNGVVAQIVSWAATLVVAIVPSSSTGPLQLTTGAGLTVTAATNYTVTTPASTNPVVYDMTLAGQFGHTIQDFDSGSGYRKRTGMAQSPTLVTNAASVTVRLVSEMITLGYGGNRATVDVFVDGAYYSTIQATQAAATDYPVSLPGDGQSHTVYFVEGLAMYKTGSTYGGTYLVSLTVPGGTSSSLSAFVRKAKRLAYSSDSILAGDHASSPSRAIMLQQRALYPQWEIADIGFCGRTATEAWDTDDLQNTQVSALSSWLNGGTEKVLAIQLGANDANQNKDPQGYQTRMALVVDKMHVADKDVKVALIRPFYTNYSGLSDSTLQVLRDRMQAVANQRGNYCHFIDTSSDITSSNSGQYQADGLHFNDAGHAYEASRLGQQLTSLAANTADAVYSNPYQHLDYGRVFSDLAAGDLGGQDTWNRNSGNFTVSSNGLLCHASYLSNPVGILFAKQTYGDHRVLLRVSRQYNAQIFLVLHHQNGGLTDPKTGFWITGTSDERYDSGVETGDPGGNPGVTSFTPFIANDVPLNRSTEFWMEAQTSGNSITYRSWTGDAVSDRPNAPQATRTLPDLVKGAGYIGLLTTVDADVLVKEMRIYTA